MACLIHDVDQGWCAPQHFVVDPWVLTILDSPPVLADETKQADEVGPVTEKVCCSLWCGTCAPQGVDSSRFVADMGDQIGVAVLPDRLSRKEPTPR